MRPRPISSDRILSFFHFRIAGVRCFYRRRLSDKDAGDGSPAIGGDAFSVVRLVDLGEGLDGRALIGGVDGRRISERNRSTSDFRGLLLVARRRRRGDALNRVQGAGGKVRDSPAVGVGFGRFLVVRLDGLERGGFSRGREGLDGLRDLGLFFVFFA